MGNNVHNKLCFLKNIDYRPHFQNKLDKLFFSNILKTVRARKLVTSHEMYKIIFKVNLLP